MTKPFVIPKTRVWQAVQRVKANGGGAGVDNESIEAYLDDSACRAPAQFRARSCLACPFRRRDRRES